MGGCLIVSRAGLGERQLQIVEQWNADGAVTGVESYYCVDCGAHIGARNVGSGLEDVFDGYGELCAGCRAAIEAQEAGEERDEQLPLWQVHERERAAQEAAEDDLRRLGFQGHVWEG